jgi:hypothetical protein
MPSIRIRRAHVSDLDTLAKLFNAYRVFYAQRLRPCIVIWLLGALIAAPLAALQLPQARHATADSSPAAITEVVVLGMIHGGHRSSEKWGIEQLRETIRRVKPDVVLCEIPPDRWPQALKVWREKQVIEDDRIRRFPEYTDVLLPLMDEMHFAIEPCAAWTTEMNQARNKDIQKFERGGLVDGQSSSDAQEFEAYHQADAWVEQWAAEHPVDQNDPLVIHSRHYDYDTKGSLLPYEHWLDNRIAVGGWTDINQSHYALIEAALKRHVGKRVLITFGAGHKYWFLEQLRWRDDLKVLDPRPFLPGGLHSRTDQERVEEEVYAFAENVWRCFNDQAGTFMRPALQRLDDSMSPKDAFTFLNGLRRSPQGSTFLDLPWLGKISVVAEQSGVWKVRMPIYQALADLDKPKFATATLTADESRPGSFRWSEIDWPR